MTKKRKREDHIPHQARLCKYCSSMTSTLRGLQALASKDGHRRNYRDLVDEANRGCSFCTLALGVVADAHDSSRTLLESLGTSAYVTFTAGHNIYSTEPQYSKERDGPTKYPFRKGDFKVLHTELDPGNGRPKVTCVMVSVYAPEGESFKE
jgi:hypothetical protein